MKKVLGTIYMMAIAIGSFAQTADEIVQKHINAMGGAEKLKKLKTVTMEGSMNVMGNDVSVKIFQENNKGMRQNISISGMDGYTIVTPTEGWSYMPFMGQTAPEAVPEADLKQSIDDLDLESALLNYKEKGHTVSYEGTEDIAGTACYKLKVNRKNSGESLMFLDPSTYYIVRSVVKREAMGQTIDMQSDLSDYRDVEGYKMPFAITQQYGTVNFSSIKINEKLPDDIFIKK